MTNKTWMSIFAIIFAAIMQLIVRLVFDAPAWAGLMMFFVALTYFRTAINNG